MQSSALLGLHIPENNKFSIKYLIIPILMATTCPTTEAALQAGLLPAQERRKGSFAKIWAYGFNLSVVSLFLCIPLYKWPSESFSDGLRLLQNQISVAPAQAGAQCKAALCLAYIFLKIINLQ